MCIFVPVTPRVKGYIEFREKYVIGRRKRCRPRKVYYCGWKARWICL